MVFSSGPSQHRLASDAVHRLFCKINPDPFSYQRGVIDSARELQDDILRACVSQVGRSRTNKKNDSMLC